MDFWNETLEAPKKIVAPMVDASELPFRLLCRRYGAELCYTPMLHSSIFARDPKYRREALASSPEDKPLIVQFCGNDPDIMLEAARLAEDHCLAIDVNLGCPQAIAKRGHYGAYLQDEWPLLQQIVSKLSENLKIPVTCKIRVFESLEKTLDYARMLEKAGCKILTVHGRVREQKGPLTGLADWSYVKAVKKAVKIPVISNGNIQCIQDLEKCLEETGCDGVMSAEGILHNPALFTSRNPPVWEPASEYLDLVEKYPCPFSYIRGHLFKLMHKVLNRKENDVLRMELGAANSMEKFRKIVDSIREKYKDFHEGSSKWVETVDKDNQNLSLPPWLCQPYVRDDPVVYFKKLDVDNVEFPKRHYEDEEGNQISRKKMKKLRRINRRPKKDGVLINVRSMDKCADCVNPLGSKCAYKLCKKCCKDKCFLENLDCLGHRIMVKTRRETAQFHSMKKLLVTN